MAITLNGTTGITTPDVNSDGLTVDSTTLVVDEANNRVGIGTSSPTAPLDVKVGTGNFTVGLQGAGNALLTASATMQLDTAGAGSSMVFKTVGTERARIDSSGNVGIGTSSPSSKLHLSGAATADARLTFTQTTAGLSGQIQQGSTGYAISALGSQAMLFETNGTERARLDQSGNLLVGTTSGAGTGRIYNPAAYNTTTGSAANCVVDSNGLFQRSTSSLKYKTDIQDATHGLTEVLTLRSVTYKGLGENDGDKVFGGLIAEEVHEAGLTEFVQYADDGSPDALAYGNMVSLCVKAIQEQQALITAQQTALQEALTKIETLEARVAALEAA